MRVLGITARKIVIGVEFTPEEFVFLKWFLDNSVVDYDGENEFENSAQGYVTKDLYPKVVELLEEVQNATG